MFIIHHIHHQNHPVARIGNPAQYLRIGASFQITAQLQSALVQYPAQSLKPHGEERVVVRTEIFEIHIDALKVLL